MDFRIGEQPTRDRLFPSDPHHPQNPIANHPHKPDRLFPNQAAIAYFFKSTSD
jgi:hypothetical protein